jgi:hypothetical protein
LRYLQGWVAILHQQSGWDSTRDSKTKPARIPDFPPFANKTNDATRRVLYARDIHNPGHPSNRV